MPRDDSAAHKEAPCGVGIAKGPVKKVYPAGTTQIPVEFEETIGHGGWFAIDLSLGNDQNFTLIDMMKDPDNGLTSTKGAPRMVTIPAGTTCANCTLRLRQVMCTSDKIPVDDAKCVATLNSGISTYHSCADIQIGAGTADAGAPTDAGGTATTDSGTSTTVDASTTGTTDAGSTGPAPGGGNPDESDGEFNGSSGSCSTSESGGGSLLVGGMIAAAVAFSRRRRR